MRLLAWVQAQDLPDSRVSTECACRAHKQWQRVLGTDKAEVYCKPDSRIDRLQLQCTALQEMYTPPIWARNNHVHLISATGELRQLLACSCGESFCCGS